MEVDLRTSDHVVLKEQKQGPIIIFNATNIASPLVAIAVAATSLRTPVISLYHAPQSLP